MERWFSNQEQLPLNPEDQSLDPSTHVRYLTNACNTSSKGPDVLC